MSEPANGGRTVDVVILAALTLEFDAVLQVNAGAIDGTAWQREAGPNGLPSSKTSARCARSSGMCAAS